MASILSKRGFLRNFAKAATDGGLSLYSALLSANNSSVAAIVSGRVLIGTSVNGQSVNFQVGQNGELTPTQVLDLFAELLDFHDAAVAHLGGTPTDAAIVAAILGKFLRPVKVVSGHDYSGVTR